MSTRYVSKRYSSTSLKLQLETFGCEILRHKTTAMLKNSTLTHIVYRHRQNIKAHTKQREK